MGKMLNEPSRLCNVCFKEGKPVEEELAHKRFLVKVRTGALPEDAHFEDYDWLQCHGSKPWAAPKAS
jgi:hypothetical protein